MTRSRKKWFDLTPAKRIFSLHKSYLAIDRNATKELADGI